MKTPIRNLSLALFDARFFFLAVAAILPTIAGCTTTSGGGYSFRLTQMNVDWKMTAYREAVAAGNVTAGQEQKVSAAYQAFQTAFQQAAVQANGNLEAPAPPNVRQLATELIGLIDSLN